MTRKPRVFRLGVEVLEDRRLLAGDAGVSPPTAPTNLVALALGKAAIALTWSPATDDVGVTGYRVFRDGAEVGTSATPGYTDPHLAAATTYTYTVVAVDTDGNVSAMSSTAAEMTDVIKPTGLFSSAAAQDPEVLSDPAVHGVLIRAFWSDVEVSPGVYNFASIQTQVNAVKAAGLSYSLAIAAGPHCPTWLYSQYGVTSLPYYWRAGFYSMPLPWDATTQTRLGLLAQALGNQFGSDPALALVYVSQITQNGIEGQLPGNDSPLYHEVGNEPPHLIDNSWPNLGWTEDLWVQTSETNARAFAAAFPSKPLAFEVHEVVGNVGAPTRIITDLWNDPTLHHRVGAAMWWISGKTTYQPNLISALAAFPGDKYAQVIDKSSNSASFLNSDYATVFSQAQTLGFRYAEPWEYEFKTGTNGANGVWDAVLASFNSYADSFVNHAPVAVGEQYRATPGQAFQASLAGNDFDADGNALTYTVVTNPAHGTLSLAADGSFTYTPQSGFRGDDSFSYSVSDGHAGSATATATIALREIIGRKVFYNHSAFDGNDPAANAADDEAIAPDKTALLPGGTATFANYTSYVRGINGIIVDIGGLSSPLTAADFEFRVGNDNAPAAWALAATPTISIRWGAGALLPDGVTHADRVTLTWEDYYLLQNGNWVLNSNGIGQKWLQVTVKANANTGLIANDVFYFGNAIGETGDSLTSAVVNIVDFGGARDNPHNAFNRALITDAYDFDRDQFVNVVELGLVRDNGTNAFNDLNLITVPASAGLADAGRGGTTSESAATGELETNVGISPAVEGAIAGAFLTAGPTIPLLSSRYARIAEIPQVRAWDSTIALLSELVTRSAVAAERAGDGAGVRALAAVYASTESWRDPQCASLDGSPLAEKTAGKLLSFGNATFRRR